MRWTLVLLLSGPVLAQGFEASPAVEAQLKAGDELRAKGDLDGAIAAYRKAVTACRAALAEEDGKAPEGKEEPAPEPAPTDDGSPEGRTRVIAYYVKLLSNAGDEVRYNAAAQLGEMRAVEARDALIGTLERDKYQVARRAAAWALGRLGKEGVVAIPALIREIGGEFPLLGHMCDRALGDITEAFGDRVTMDYRAEMTPAERLGVQKKWQEWFEKNRERLGVPAEKPAEAPAAEKAAEPPPEPPPVEKPADPPPAEGGG